MSLMQFYHSAGIRYVVIKAATGDQLFNGCLKTPQFTRALVTAAHDHALWIFGYNRSSGANIKGEIAIAHAERALADAEESKTRYWQPRRRRGIPGKLKRLHGLHC